MTIRERTENLEESTLSKYAVLSKNSSGRIFAEEKCPNRTDFQRDKDRIVHSKAFRRLMHKTQVFLTPRGDHYRTRLTHSMEVSQVARVVARALRLNEDLTEAIALGHDIGHSPFGHEGEATLNRICPGGFKHFEQGVRTIQIIEKNGKGLNLTAEILDGILNHTRGELPKTLEGQIVRICDKIAYMSHDIDDFIRAGIFNADDMPSEIMETLGNTHKIRTGNLVASLIENSVNGEIQMAQDDQEAFDKIHSFMYSLIYTSKKIRPEAEKVPLVLESLYFYYKTRPEKLPDYFKNIIDKDGIDRAVCDYVSGMTDNMAIYVFKSLVIPKGISVMKEPL